MSNIKINIVTSAFNNLEMTKIMYESVKKYTDVPYKHIIVENNSVDGTREWLKSIDDPNLEKIFPEKNLGGVGARNVGIDNMDEDSGYFVSTDNDIVFTEYWASRFVDFMEKNKTVGISGPSTNFAGNPQIIKDVPKFSIDDIEGIQSFSENIYKKYPSFSIAPDTWPVVGFCFFVRREVINQVGKFDENLVSWADETDYCRRAEIRGWKMAYINYIYIHHWGHASKGTPGAHYITEMSKSIEYFKNKWGS